MSDRANPYGRMLAELKRAETRAAACGEQLSRYLAGGPDLSNPVEVRRCRKLEGDLKLAQQDCGWLMHRVDQVTGRVP